MPAVPDTAEGRGRGLPDPDARTTRCYLGVIAASWAKASRQTSSEATANVTYNELVDRGLCTTRGPLARVRSISSWRRARRTRSCSWLVAPFWDPRWHGVPSQHRWGIA